VRPAELEISTFVAPAFAQNAYIVRLGTTADGIAIDPGAAAGAMAEHAERHGFAIAAIVLTHAHLDHVEGVGVLAARTRAPVWLHPADRMLYDNVAAQASAFGMSVGTLPPPDHALEAGPLEIAGLRFDVRHVPGHAPGHVILYLAEHDCAFVGDVVFQGSIGRSDLPGGDYQQLIESIRTQLLTLPDETRLYTGHGPPTTIGHERATNPFLIPQYGGGLA
jgi:hydroxyacylglutathione hydrolase